MTTSFRHSTLCEAVHLLWPADRDRDPAGPVPRLGIVGHIDNREPPRCSLSTSALVSVRHSGQYSFQAFRIAVGPTARDPSRCIYFDPDGPERGQGAEANR